MANRRASAPPPRATRQQMLDSQTGVISAAQREPLANAWLTVSASAPPPGATRRQMLASQTGRHPRRPASTAGKCLPHRRASSPPPGVPPAGECLTHSRASSPPPGVTRRQCLAHSLASSSPPGVTISVASMLPRRTAPSPKARAYAVHRRVQAYCALAPCLVAIAKETQLAHSRRIRQRARAHRQHPHRRAYAS